MKTEVIRLLNSENSYLKINDFAELHRWKKDALGNEVDKLKLIFNLTHSQSRTYDIESRDWKKIIEEVQVCQLDAFNSTAEELNRRLQGGKLN